jgi:hypothetical protein
VWEISVSAECEEERIQGVGSEVWGKIRVRVRARVRRMRCVGVRRGE